jgi:hypothetical protein
MYVRAITSKKGKKYVQVIDISSCMYKVVKNLGSSYDK